MNQLIAVPLLGKHVLACHGELDALAVTPEEFRKLTVSTTLDSLPYLKVSAKEKWPDAFKDSNPRLIIREPELRFARASWEITELCNYDCEHCYLGKKVDRSLDWQDREKLIDLLDKSGILSLQMTGGEVLADRFFSQTYAAVWDKGIMINLQTNGSRLSKPEFLNLLCDRVPQRITISMYGATEATYDALTLRLGAYKKFIRGLEAVREVGLRVRLNIIVTTHNQHEREGMVRLAESFGFESFVYDEMTPTIYGGSEPISFQATDRAVKERVFSGCSAGKTFYHVGQTGHAMVCKVGRKPYIDLLNEGVESLRKLNCISDELLKEDAMPAEHKGRICAPQSRLRFFDSKKTQGKLMLRVI